MTRTAEAMRTAADSLCACGHPEAEHVRVSNAPGLVCAHSGEDREGVCECMNFVKAAQPGDCEGPDPEEDADKFDPEQEEEEG